MRLQKFFGFPGCRFRFSPLPPLLLAAGVIELVAGMLVTIGLFTRLAAFIAAGEMAVAYWMMHFAQEPVAGRRTWARRRSCSASSSSISPPRDRVRGASTARTQERADQVTFARSLEARLVPFARCKDLGEDFGGAHHLGEAVVERREAEAHQVGRAEIADDAARDQRLHHRIAVAGGRRRRGCRAAPGRAARRGEPRRRSALRPRR